MASRKASGGTRYLILRQGKTVYFVRSSALESSGRAKVNKAIDEYVAMKGDPLDGVNFALFAGRSSQIVRAFCEFHPGGPIHGCAPKKSARRKKKA